MAAENMAVFLTKPGVGEVLGARIVETTRKIWFHMPSSFLEQETWRRIYAVLVSD